MPARTSFRFRDQSVACHEYLRLPSLPSSILVLVLSSFYVFAGSKRRFQSPHDLHSVIVLPRDKTLARKLFAKRLRTICRSVHAKRSNDPLHGLRSINGMKSRKNQPVSAACSALSMVSSSRISPKRITFGAVSKRARSRGRS
jgi:hypothetical protein